MQKYVDLIAFLYKLISKEQAVVITEFPDWVQVKEEYTMAVLYHRRIIGQDELCNAFLVRLIVHLSNLPV